MIRTITRQKPLAGILVGLGEARRVFIVGCGTCSTMCRTGGVAEVAAMADALGREGLQITGTAVPPVACDDLDLAVLDEQAAAIDAAQAVLVLACGFGAQSLGARRAVPVVPGVDTLFVGKERGPGRFEEICRQCAECVLADTGGICPVASCHKGLLNGPCGGTRDGKCEVDREMDCAWTLIYQRLDRQGRLDRMRRLQPPRDHRAVLRPGRLAIQPGEEEQGDAPAA